MKLCPKCQKHFSDDANFCPVDAARLIPLEGQGSAADSLSTRFELGDKLGGGRTGIVYKATDKQGGGKAAVKVVAASVIALPGVAQRLERELKHIEKVTSAGVAKVLASGKRGDDTWVATELLEGAQTLAGAIARGPIALDQAAHLIEVVGEALIEAAQVGVVHRDLAPKNILFAGSDIKLINFSLPVPTTTAVPGVAEFVAPEQVEGKPVDQRSNLYSLGALYYYVLTGQPPHTGSTDEVHKAHANGTIRPPSQLASVPAPVEAAILRALDRSPTKRFLTVRQFVDEVSRIARGETSPSGTQPMGKIGRAKAELVQTLIGVRLTPGQVNGGGASLPASGGTPAITSAATVGAGIPALASTPAPQSAPVAMTATIAGMPAGALAAAADRSPWASPAGAQPGVMAGAQAAVASAAPQIAQVTQAPQMPPPMVVAPMMPVVPAAPVMPAAPVLPAAPVMPAAPVVAGAPAKKKAEPEGKGKFRETMWFKKGDLDAQAAVSAAEERERTGKEVVTDKADSLPIDERYKDDGSITRGDKDKYSLRTGATMMMASVKDPNPTTSAGASMSGGKVSEGDLIGEMKGGRTWVIVAILVAVLGIGALIFMIAH